MHFVPDETTLLIIKVILIIAVTILIARLQKWKRKYKRLEREYREYKLRFDGIVDVEEHLRQKRSELSIIEHQISELKNKYKHATEVYNKLNDDIYLYQDNLDLIEYGVYEPHFDFDTSDSFKEAILKNRELQKNLISEGNAVECYTTWSVGNSKKQGEIKTKKGIKLTTRAFNGECDTLISKVKWNNIETFEKRIYKAFDTINKLNKSNDIHIQQLFLELKLQELRLTHEYELKKNEEKEEQRRIREQIREEEKARKDYERAILEAEKEEKLLAEAMQKARKELEKASEEERLKYENQLSDLMTKLEEAEAKNQRALSMAQQTKSGHVYVISNIGSFGENVYKIGMTRRLEPMDRVNELGDASVPFKFDVHAMIYSDNAPELESKLHKEFHNKRINHINLRREYFGITLEEIEKVVHDNFGEIEFTKLAEAKEYRESLVIRNKLELTEEKLELPQLEKVPTLKELFNL